MDAATLTRAMPYLAPARAQQLIAGCNQAMLLGGMNSPRRCAMFLAQIGEESGSLRYEQEIQPPPGASYPPYIGRTFIQITWRSNYAAFGAWCARNRLLTDPNTFVNNPASLATDRWAWLGPVWYWTTHGLNSYADRGDVTGATRVINGGYNGLIDRQSRYNRCIALGDALLPDNGGLDMAITLSQIINGVAGLRGINRLTQRPATLVQFLDQINYTTYTQLTEQRAANAAIEQRLTALEQSVAANKPTGA